jgi:hypothetical protein
MENTFNLKKFLAEGKLLKEDFQDFRESDEMGWMEVTMEEISEEQNLDLEYRSDFDIAFNEALNKLKNEHPELDFDLIEKYKEDMF